MSQAEKDAVNGDLLYVTVANPDLGGTDMSDQFGTTSSEEMNYQIMVKHQALVHTKNIPYGNSYNRVPTPNSSWYCSLCKLNRCSVGVVTALFLD